ncbi:predicted protein [Pyrenophora tritici-repentis Pt-1C-BFP]|uniref:Uncharacterized protein n=1 Tax=Pyrenophora tritici-repentis (strain Pt-1C-BFP) TaxID=426418 RepID=B2W147_PYRTR|nr:uncharacterized protein PTRG_04182 [Pyrenophora tritici-repentis Pt-1C-BFP]EDU47020.1 predicted protein [Pyrenophora tritici-repentis Pt-1C-BFP]
MVRLILLGRTQDAERDDSAIWRISVVMPSITPSPDRRVSSLASKQNPIAKGRRTNG